MNKSRGWILGLIAAVVVITTGIFLLRKNINKSENAFLEKYGFKGFSVEEIVNKLDGPVSDPDGLKASITSDQLILTDISGEVRLPLPKDKFYLSFAPYVTLVHPCGTHSLISCRGELFNQQVHAVITDNRGKEIVNSDFTTMDNGFVAVWLPRNISATVTVNYKGLTAQAPIATFAGDNTCLTTPLKLN